MSRGNPIIGRPRSLHEREQAEAEAAIDRREAELDEAALSRKPLDLSPEEVAALNREKREIAEELRAKRPPRPGRERSAPISLSSHEVVDEGHAPERIAPTPAVVPAPVLDADPSPHVALIEELDAEIAQLQVQLAEAQRREATESQRRQTDYDVKIGLLRKEQHEAEAKAKDARERMSGVHLAEAVTKAEQQAKQNRSYEEGQIAEKQQAVFQILQPKIEQAQRTLVAMRAFEKANGATLERLAAMTWKSAPAEWEPKYRMQMQERVYLPARELLTTIRKVLTNTPKLIEEAERTIETGGINGVSQISFEIGTVTADHVRNAKEQLGDLNARIKDVTERASATATPGRPAEIVILLEGPARVEQKQYMLDKHLRSQAQTHAVLDVGSVKPRADRADQ
jgi:hypothetical protein